MPRCSNCGVTYYGASCPTPNCKQPAPQPTYQVLCPRCHYAHDARYGCQNPYCSANTAAYYYPPPMPASGLYPPPPSFQQPMYSQQPAYSQPMAYQQQVGCGASFGTAQPALSSPQKLAVSSPTTPSKTRQPTRRLSQPPSPKLAPQKLAPSKKAKEPAEEKSAGGPSEAKAANYANAALHERIQMDDCWRPDTLTTHVALCVRKHFKSEEWGCALGVAQHRNGMLFIGLSGGSKTQAALYRKLSVWVEGNKIKFRKVEVTRYKNPPQKYIKTLPKKANKSCCEALFAELAKRDNLAAFCAVWMGKKHIAHRAVMGTPLMTPCPTCREFIPKYTAK